MSGRHFPNFVDVVVAVAVAEWHVVVVGWHVALHMPSFRVRICEKRKTKQRVR